MVVDNIGNALYVNSGALLYKCLLSSGGVCSILGAIGNVNSVVGLAIGSSISD